MDTEHTETVVEKAVTFVKDMFGIHSPAPDVEARPEYADSAPEITSENAMRLNPNAFAMESIEQMEADSHVAPETAPFGKRNGAQASMNTMGETDAERLRREVDEHPHQKSVPELKAEIEKFEIGK